MYLWRIVDGMPGGDCVSARWTAPSTGLFASFSQFDPCGDELVLVGSTQETSVGGDALTSPPGLMVFVDLEKSFVSGVIVEAKRLPLPQRTPVGVVWSSPSTILTLHAVSREYEVYSTTVCSGTTDKLRQFSKSRYKYVSVLPSERGDTTVAVHVFIGVSWTVGVVWCNVMSKANLQTLGGGDWSVVERVCNDKFVMGCQLDTPCLVDSKGNLVSWLTRTRASLSCCDVLFPIWMSNNKWLVNIEDNFDKTLRLWRIVKGVPVGDCISLNCTAHFQGSASFSPFDPCGDELVWFRSTEDKHVEKTMNGDAFTSAPGLMVFVDLEKSFVSGVIVETKSFPLPQQNPVEVMWSSPSAILTLHHDLGRGYEVYSATADQLRQFSKSMYERVSVLPSDLVAALLFADASPSPTTKRRAGVQPLLPSSSSSSSLCVCEVYSPSDFSQPSCCYERPLREHSMKCSSVEIYCFKMDSEHPEQIVASINDASTGLCLAILTITCVFSLSSTT
ncbi:hypothetical protein Pelo_1452 [Pelomyxa schiedti]|nr:hypothetical protein Pelo_1452 [Pelomyxa schiedti]